MWPKAHYKDSEFFFFHHRTYIDRLCHDLLISGGPTIGNPTDPQNTGTVVYSDFPLQMLFWIRYGAA